MKHSIPLLILALLLCAMPAQAQKKKKTSPVTRITGLSVGVDAGLLIPNAKQANFYSGRPGNDNTISRVLYRSNTATRYGTASSTGSSSPPAPSPPTAPSA